MPQTKLQNFGVFSQEKSGPIWKGFFDDLEEAKRFARACAASGELEFFVYSLLSGSEVARYFPKKPSTSMAGD